MERFCREISEIKIHSNDVRDVYDVVKNTNDTVLLIANETQKMGNLLIKYGASNTGRQYELATKQVVDSSEKLRESVDVINHILKQVCLFLNKVLKYEMYNDEFHSIETNIKQINFSAIKSKLVVSTEEMEKLLKYLCEYIEITKKYLKKIKNEKNEIGHIWKDRCYMAFSEEVDRVIYITEKILKPLEEYCSSLGIRLKELRS